jgi:hypothetical protein
MLGGEAGGGPLWLAATLSIYIITAGLSNLLDGYVLSD